MKNKKGQVLFIAVWTALTTLIAVATFSLGRFSMVLEHGGGTFFRPPFVNTYNDQVDFSLFWEAYRNLKANYNGNLDDRHLLYGAINGMAQATGDPYTSFLSEEQLKRLNDELSGNFEGIGAEIGLRDNQITVISPLEGSPAMRAGLQSQDIIVAIDDKSTLSMSVEEAVSLIRGPKGTSVKLSILRGTKELSIEIERDNIVIKSVEWELKSGNIGYIRLSSFGDDTTKEMRLALDEFNSKNTKGLILDMRNNPGGYLDVAIDVASFFVAKGEVVVWEKEKYKMISLKSRQNPIYQDKPIVVLINEGSASASEIVAGALRDLKQSQLVGQTSFGKGSVQSVNNLRSGALKVTVARWLTPNKTALDDGGLEPDVIVETEPQDIFGENDAQLNEALRMIQQ